MDNEDGMNNEKETKEKLIQYVVEIFHCYVLNCILFVRHFMTRILFIF